MSVRFKSLIIISATILFLMIALNYYSRVILMGSFEDLERDEVRQDVERVLNLISDDIAGIDTINHDWAAWDDTYRFMEDGNSTYIESNLMDQTFGGVNVNIMLFLNTAGETTYSKGFDLERMKEVPVPPELVDYTLANWGVFGNSDPEDHITGIVLIPQGAMMISAHQILSSEARGPIRGRLIMGRYLDAAEIARLSELARLPITIRLLGESDAPPDFKDAGASLLAGEDIVAKPISDDFVSGYGLLSDVPGQPILVVQTKVPRDIYAQGERTLWFFTWALIGASVAVCIVSLILLDRMVLKRLFRLRDDVGSIGKAGHPDARVSMTGNDELTDLAREVNNMLNALENYQSEVAQKRALEAANKELRELDRLKSKFISMASHELRTPLIAIQGYVDLIRDEDSGGLSAEERKMLDTISQNTKRLTRIVAELLDLSRIEENKLVLRKDAVSVKEVVELVANELGSSIKKRGIAFSMEIHPSLPRIVGDRDRLAEVLTNLVGNAIKYTRDGGHIHVGAWIEENDRIHIIVSDTGIGIDPEHLDRIFDRFYEVADAVHHSTGTDEFMAGGTGLGLSIVKEIVRMHGGRVWGESEGKGKGATFHVVLPINPEIGINTAAETDDGKANLPAETREGEERAIGNNGHFKILVIENGGQTSAAIRHMFENGYDITGATTSGTGIKEAIAGKPNLILLDALMPGISGFDICKTLKSNANTKAIPIIIFGGVTENKEKAKAAGADAYLTEPIGKEHLVGLIEGFGRR